jgi:hypothetical protein
LYDKKTEHTKLIFTHIQLFIGSMTSQNETAAKLLTIKYCTLQQVVSSVTKLICSTGNKQWNGTARSYDVGGLHSKKYN